VCSAVPEKPKKRRKTKRKKVRVSNEANRERQGFFNLDKRSRGIEKCLRSASNSERNIQ